MIVVVFALLSAYMGDLYLCVRTIREARAFVSWVGFRPMITCYLRNNSAPTCISSKQKSGHLYQTRECVLSPFPVVPQNSAAKELPIISTLIWVFVARFVVYSGLQTVLRDTEKHCQDLADPRALSNDHDGARCLQDFSTPTVFPDIKLEACSWYQVLQIGQRSIASDI